MFEEFETHRVDVGGGIEIFARSAGVGPAILALHGYPQTHACWHRVAPALVKAGYRVVVSDLRGYGRSSKPPADEEHAAYSKRAMAQDQVALMRALGEERFFLAGHDRGGRVAHRLAVDYPGSVEKLSVLDIVPTLAMYEATNKAFATAYYHWFFLIQPKPFPETLIGADPDWFLRYTLASWAKTEDAFSDEAIADYSRAFADPECVHATCEDYRAAAGIDLDHDRSDIADGKKIAAPLLVLWGTRGIVAREFDALGDWRKVAKGPVTGRSYDCGHFLPEEAAASTAEALIDFFAARRVSKQRAGDDIKTEQ